MKIKWPSESQLMFVAVAVFAVILATACIANRGPVEHEYSLYDCAIDLQHDGGIIEYDNGSDIVKYYVVAGLQKVSYYNGPGSVKVYHTDKVNGVFTKEEEVTDLLINVWQIETISIKGEIVWTK